MTLRSDTTCQAIKLCQGMNDSMWSRLISTIMATGKLKPLKMPNMQNSQPEKSIIRISNIQKAL
jgi:hypothetical protein